MADAQGKRGGGCWKWGCITGLLGVAAIVTYLAGLWSWGRGTVPPYAEDFQAAMDRQNYKGAYEMTGDLWRAKMPYKEFVVFAEAVRAVLGTCRKMDMAGLNVQGSTNGTFAVATYRAQFTNGEATLVFTLKRKGGDWVVEGANYLSPLMVALLRCDYCGAINKEYGQFCSQCGKPRRRPAGEEKPPAKPEPKRPSPATWGTAE